MFALLSNVGSAFVSAGKWVIGGTMSFFSTVGSFVFTVAKGGWSLITGTVTKVLGWVGLSKATAAAAITPAAVAAAAGDVVVPAMVPAEAALAMVPGEIVMVGAAAPAVAGAAAYPAATASIAGSVLTWTAIGLGGAVIVLGGVSLGRVLYKKYVQGMAWNGFWEFVKGTAYLPIEVVKDAWHLVKTGAEYTWAGVKKPFSWTKMAAVWTWDKVKAAGSWVASWFKSATPVSEGGLAKDLGVHNDPRIAAVDPELAAVMAAGAQ